MPVLTTETRLSAREANDIMEYVQKYRTDYGRIQRYVWRVIVRQNGAVNKKAHGEFRHIRYEGAL